jgi:hypothetical protein
MEVEILVDRTFWKRLEMFVSNVQVNDAMSDEEKEYILRTAKRNIDYQGDKTEKVVMYKFQLENVKEALRVTANTYGCRKKITCHDRMVTQAEQYTKNALANEIDKEVKWM